MVFAERSGARPDAGSLELGREVQRGELRLLSLAADRAHSSLIPLARAMVPIAPRLNTRRADVWLLCVHVVACFLGLAALPFTRLFHLVADPVSLLASGAATEGAGARQTAAGANAATLRVVGLDACVQCGACDEHCSVLPAYRMLANVEVLPSRKVLSTRGLAAGRLLAEEALRAVSEGAYICTSCRRCTAICPVGIDLQDLWSASREDLAALGHPAPQVWIQEKSAAEWAERAQLLPASAASAVRSPGEPRRRSLSDDPTAFVACIQCQTCTNMCPVVAHNTCPEAGVDLTPQKVMNLLRLGLMDMAMGSRMVWECATCYQCQEHCPQGIPVDGHPLRTPQPRVRAPPIDRATERRCDGDDGATEGRQGRCPPAKRAADEIRPLPGVQDPRSTSRVRPSDAGRALCISGSRSWISSSTAAATRSAASIVGPSSSRLRGTWRSPRGKGSRS